MIQTEFRKVEMIPALLEHFSKIDLLVHRDGGIEKGGWKWLADILPVDFETAMRSTNPDFQATPSYPGPFTRFVEAIVPLITGDHPTAASVASFYKSPDTSSRFFKERRGR